MSNHLLLMSRRINSIDEQVTHQMIWELRNIEYCLNYLIEQGKLNESKKTTFIPFNKGYAPRQFNINIPSAVSKSKGINQANT